MANLNSVKCIESFKHFLDCVKRIFLPTQVIPVHLSYSEVCDSLKSLYLNLAFIHTINGVLKLEYGTF